MCKGINVDLFHSSTCLYLVMPASFVEYVCLFSLYNFSFFVKNQVSIGVWIYIRVFYSVPFFYLFVFVPIPSCFYYSSFIVELEVRECDASRCSFIFQGCFGYPGLLFFHMKLSIVLSRSVKNCVGILMGITLNL